MRAIKLISFLFFAIFFSGCIVYSFYPLYTPEDLFANNILAGSWTDSDSAQWNFQHSYKGKKIPENIDSTSYDLIIKDKDEKTSEFKVHIIQLGGNYFLDFYLEELNCKSETDLAGVHVLPVHSFAKLKVRKNQLLINWFDPEWLKKLIEENKIRIHHENNGEAILLTAQPKELQKFVTKYVNTEDAFKDGLNVELTMK